MHSYALFPLTLPLSPREREMLLNAWDYSQNGGYCPTLPMVLPLPKGEGWGEGERCILLNSYAL
jgi:hypothetical protein